MDKTQTDAAKQRRRDSSGVDTNIATTAIASERDAETWRQRRDTESQRHRGRDTQTIKEALTQGEEEIFMSY